MRSTLLGWVFGALFALLPSLTLAFVVSISSVPLQRQSSFNHGCNGDQLSLSRSLPMRVTVTTAGRFLRHSGVVRSNDPINNSAKNKWQRSTILRSSSSSSSSSPTSTNTHYPILESWGVGIRRDFSKRQPFYKSDIMDGLCSQSVAAVMFLFFACLTPAIGFGGLLDNATLGAMGAMEMLLSTAACGVLYALCAPQPMQLIGPMGPTLAFTISLSQLAKQMSLSFLPLYAWTGLWMAGFLTLAALTSVSNIAQYLTRFTDEIFSVLISTIFLVGAVSDVAAKFNSLDVNAPTALLTLVCALVTFGSATFLRGLKQSIYFTKSIRNNLSSFAPAIGVLLGSLVARAMCLKYGTSVAALPVLNLPVNFATTSGRPWLIPLLDLPVWARWSAIFPALLGTVLLFLDQTITARLVNNPRFQMVKGRCKGDVIDGMHGDLFVLSLLTGITSLLGLPWMAGATTRSAVHVRSLILFNDDGTIRGILENRVSGAAIHALIGTCIFFPWPRLLISQIPIPVLSGIFMYLGFTSLQGLELWDRMKEVFHDSTVAPSTRWSEVPKWSNRIVTAVQVGCVALLMQVTQSKSGVLAPFIIALLPLLRMAIIKSGLVSNESMHVLDA